MNLYTFEEKGERVPETRVKSVEKLPAQGSQLEPIAWRGTNDG